MTQPGFVQLVATVQGPPPHRQLPQIVVPHGTLDHSGTVEVWGDMASAGRAAMCRAQGRAHAICTDCARCGRSFWPPCWTILIVPWLDSRPCCRLVQGWLTRLEHRQVPRPDEQRLKGICQHDRLIDWRAAFTSMPGARGVKSCRTACAFACSAQARSHAERGATQAASRAVSPLRTRVKLDAACSSVRRQRTPLRKPPQGLCHLPRVSQASAPSHADHR